jgi:putative Mg2+ transporter-C (MgtC) family protein
MLIGPGSVVPGIALSDFEPLLRLLLALACGVCLGLNRDLHHKPAGFRTFGLVCVGAALVTLVTAQSAGADGSAVSRVIQGILTGIGFVGAGVIFRRESGKPVAGLTTAAAIWYAAALGIASGLGNYRLALAGLALALLILIVGGPLERYFERLTGNSEAATRNPSSRKDLS